MRGRRPKESLAQPPPTPLDHHILYHRQQPPRDSDASFASSRPSSVGLGRSTNATFDQYKDHRYQSSAVSTVNAYLSSHSSPALSLKLPFPSAKDITQTLNFLMSRLDFPSQKLDDDLPFLLRSLNYPFKLNKSILRSPGTPHQWPTFLAIIHWLVQVAMFNDHLGSDSTASFADRNPLHSYSLDSYSHYITGDDDTVESLDREWLEKLERERENSSEAAKALEASVRELEAKIEGMKAEPSRMEVLEKEKGVLEEDVTKFHEMIEKFREKIAEVERDFGGKEKELEEKVTNKDRICEENEELKKRVELQAFNPRDVERMKRELQATERDIGEAELARNSWEEKSWDLDATLGRKSKELETLAMECNQAMRRLKFGEGFQYALNAKGSTPAEVMGADYKSMIKPALTSLAEDINKNSMTKLEELIALQQQSSEIAAKIEGKRNILARLEARINEVEGQLQLLKNETQEYTYRCAAEAKKIMEDFEMEAHNLDLVEREAADILKTSKLKLQEAIKQSEAEIQMCAFELIALVDSVSKYKEHMQSKLLEMKNDVSETAAALSDAYKGSWPPKFGTVSNANN
ncbi:Kinetochore protein Ndc [Parasponia andersonii]|uniref:Kinetochore protein NDC80 n=1 Tax=Parasponia andersonii TaxID=3476 RepID=A0A2P5CGT9_PARAD|nr:Kinetochore protein Ndc [Parasponia andersonii]